jgi:NAD+ synthase
MPILQKSNQFERSKEHISWLKQNFDNVSDQELDLTSVFNSFESLLPSKIQDHLTMANLRARIRMSTLYAYASNNNKLVVGTGNKVEDFGVGFYTKYGDGGVDISPIADMLKSEVFSLAKHLDIVSSIQNAAPTDGLWEDDRSDEDQLGASYEELEWAMSYIHEKENKPISDRQKNVLDIYQKFNSNNLHKMEPIPVCIIPNKFK